MMLEEINRKKLHEYRWVAYNEYDNIFIKMNDDLVYLDLSEFENFINFRRNHPEFFLVPLKNLRLHHKIPLISL